MSGLILDSNNKVGFIGSTTLQDIINNFSVDGTGDISDLELDTMIGGELLENYGEGTEWYVRTDVAEFDQVVLGEHSNIVLDGDVQVNYNIITDVNEDKEIFTGVTSHTIKIGGNSNVNGNSVHSKVEIDGDLQVNYNILTDNDENKEIFTGVINSDIAIGGNNSTVKVGKDLFIANDIVIQGNLTQKGTTTFIHSTNTDISDNVILLNKGLSTENPNFSSGFLILRNEVDDFININDTDVIGGNIISYNNHGLSTDQEIFIQGYNYNIDGIQSIFVEKFDDNTFKVKYDDGTTINDLSTVFNLDTTKRLYNGNKVKDNQFMGWDEMNTSFMLGLTRFDGAATDERVELVEKSKLMIDNLETDFDVKVGGNITTTTQEDKELWKDIIANTITIGGANSRVDIGNDLMVYKNVLTDVDENKEIFVGVETNTIKIGGDNANNRSKTEIGGDIQVNYNILGGGQTGEDKEIFADMNNNIKIGGDESNIEIPNTLEVKDDIKLYKHLLADANEDKEIFTDVTSKVITIGGNVDDQIRSKTHIKGDLLVDFNIRSNAISTTNKEIFSGVNGQILIGGDESTFVIGNTLVIPQDITVNGNIVTDNNEPKKIFEGVVSEVIRIGGTNGALNNEQESDFRSTTEIKGDLRVNYNILGNNKDDISIFANDDYTITIGSSDSKVIVGNDLQINNNILTDLDENKEIFAGVETKTIKIGGDTLTERSKTEIVGDIQTNYNIIGGGAADQDKEIFVDMNNNIKIGGDESNIEIPNTLEVKDDIKLYKNILTDANENKEIFANVISNTIKIGGDNISLDENSNLVTLRSKTEIVGDLQVNYNILTDNDEDKEIFKDVSSKKITIGSGSSKVIMDSTDHLVIPIGNTSERSNVTGAIRYNSETLGFEGCDGNAWNTLGGVIDVDKDTFITAQDSPDADNDQLKFFTTGTERMRIDENGNVGIRYTDSQVNLYLGGTDAIKIPSGTTLERPTATDASHQGYIRWNSDKNIFEGFGPGLSWTPLAAGASIITSTNETELGIENSNNDLSLFTDSKIRMRILNNGNIAIGTPSANNPVNARVILDISGDDAIRIPSGRTNDRPNTFNDDYENEYKGFMRWNTDFNEFEGYIGDGLWGSLSKLISQDKKAYIEPFNNANNSGLSFFSASGGDSKEILKITTSGLQIFNSSGLERYTFNSDKLTTTTELEIDGKITMKGDIVSKIDSNAEIFTDIVTKTIKIGGDNLTERSKTEIAGDLQVNYNILADTDEDKEIFNNVLSKTIKIGSNSGAIRSKTEIGGDLQVNFNILTDQDEDKEIFTGVTSNTIKIGSDDGDDHSKTEIGGDLQVNYDILGGDNDNISVFTNEDYQITIGNDDSTIILGNDLQVGNNILTDQDENKEIFTGVGMNTIKIGGVGQGAQNHLHSKTEIAGDLQVNFNILSDIDEDKNIFTNVITKKINIGGIQSVLSSGYDIEVGNDVKMNGNIIAISDDEKEIFTDVTEDISIGGDGKIIFGGDIEINKNILADKDEDKEIFTGVTSKLITIGGVAGKVKLGYDVEIGNDLQVNKNIIADQDEDKEIFTGVLTKKITLGGETSEVVIGNDIQVNGHIKSDQDEDKEIFTNVINNKIKIGGPSSEISIGGDLKVNNHIISDNTENKEIFTNIAENDVTIGSNSGQVIIGNRLKVSEDIESQVTGDKKIFTNIGAHSVTLGSSFGQVIANNNLVINGSNILASADTTKSIFTNVKGLANSSIIIGGVNNDTGTKSRTIIDGTLQPNYHIVSGNVDVAKNIFTDVNTSDITIGGVGGKVVINNNLQVNNNIISEEDDDKNIFTNIVTSDINIGGVGSRLIPGGTIIFKDDLVCDVDKAKKIFEAVENNTITIGGSNCVVKFNNDIEIEGNITASEDDDKYLWNGVANSDIFIGRSGSGTLIINNDLQVNKKIISDIKEDKEIFTEINTVNNITIGGTNSTLVAGGNLKITQGLFAGEDRDLSLFNDITSKTITIGSVGCITKFNSNTHIIIPVGSNQTRTDVKGAIRYNTTYSIMEVCHGPGLWQQLGGLRSIDRKTYISTDTSLGAGDDVFEIYVNNTKRLEIDDNGDVFFTPDEKLEIDGDLHIKGDIKAVTNRNLNLFTDVTSNDITIGSGTTRVIFDSTDSIVIPSGEGGSDDRTDQIGAIRYNTTSSTFEGCDGTNWGSLGGVSDVDKDTFISAQNSAASDNDQLKFVTAGTQRMVIDSDGNIGIGIDDPQEFMHIGGDVRIDGNILTDQDEDKEIFKDIATKKIIIGSGSHIVDFNSTNHIKIPVGTNLQRNNVIGALRYNSEINTFEGYNGTEWIILQRGLGDLDGNLGIEIDNTNGKILFKTNGQNRLIIDNDGKFGFGVTTIEEKIHVDGNIKSDGIITETIESSGNIISVKNSILPATDSNLNIGQPGNKFLSAYLNEEGIWLGDYTQISFDNDELKFRVFTAEIPAYVINAYRLQPGQEDETTENIKLLAGLTIGIEVDQFTPYYWLKYLKTLGDIYDSVSISDMVRGDDSILDQKIVAGGGFTINSDNTILTTTKAINIINNLSAKHTTLDGNLQVNGSITAGGNVEKILFNDITSESIQIGSGSFKLKINSTDSFIVPIGITSERSSTIGAIRFNSEENIFQGYDGSTWRPFGTGAFDNDGDTFIQAEDNGDDNDNLIFFTKNDKRMIITDLGKIGFGLDIVPVEEFDVNMVSRFQKDLTINKNLNVHENIFAGNDDTDRTIFSDISSKKITLGSGSSQVIMNSTDHMVIPIGNTLQRTQTTGAIRYNSETLTFEGCDGTNWGSLGGVMDVDKDTYISAQNSATADNDELKFVTAGTQRMILDSQGDISIGSGVSKIVINSNDHLVIPVGNTVQRNEATGAIRYNSETLTFEGCDGTNWGSLGGVMDVDKDTYISAETSPTTDNDELKFVTAGTQRMIIDSTGIIKFNYNTIFDGNILADVDEDKEIFKDVTSKKIKLGSGSSQVIMNSTDHMVIPVGDTSQRTQTTGAMRYNSETLTFEGCDGTNWGSLGGVSDVDKDTYISAETSATVDNDELKFVTAGTQRMIIDSTGQIGIGNDFTPSTDFDVKGNAIIRGNLTVEGTRTLVNTSNLDISDNIIIVNSGLGSNENSNVSSGILVNRHDDNQFMGWDDSEDAFILGQTVNTGDEAPDNITLSSKSDLKIKDLYANDINIDGVIKSNDVKLVTNELERMVIKNDGKIGMGESSPEKELDINLETRFKKKVTAENDIELPNPSTNDPTFSILDLIGPPKSIVVNSSTNTAVNFDVNIEPIVRYHVGFTPEKLPMITHLNVKLVKQDTNTILLDTTLSNSDISDFESLNKLRFSRQAGSNNFIIGRYSFYNLTSLVHTETYKLIMSFKNYHPSLNETIEGDLSVQAPNAPDVINTFTVILPSNTQGSIDVNTYYIHNTPSFSINWNTPIANDGSINKYFVEYESIDKLNGVASGNDTVEVELGNVNNMSKSLGDGILYGTKYKFRIKSGNDAGATSEYGNYVESTYYTSVPTKPPISNISNQSIKPNSFSNIEAYNVSNYSEYDNGNFVDYNDSTRKLLRSTNTDFIDLVGFDNINCSNVLCMVPTVADKLIFRTEILNDLDNVVYSSEVEYDSFSVGSTRFTGETKTTNNENCKITVNIQDYYHNQLATNKAGYWLRANISDIAVKIPSEINFGQVRVIVNVPGIDTAQEKISSFPFMIDDLVDNPTINSDSTYIGVTENSNVTMVCGIASLNVNTNFDLDFTVDDLTSDSFIFGSTDKKQIEITSNVLVNNGIAILADDATYGVSSNENNIKSITYDEFTHFNMRLADVSMLGEDVSFLIKAYNLNGTTQYVKTLKLIRDKESINNSLKNKRYESWSGDLAWDNLPTNADWETTPYDNSINLPQEELLLWDGVFTTDSNQYKDYRGLYNFNISGSTLVNNSLTNAHWTADDDQYRWALFKLSNTVQQAGTGSFGIKFYTPTTNPFSVGITKQNTGFKCNIYLPSLLNDGDLYWYDVNKNFEAENTRTTGNTETGVTGIGIFDSKVRTTSYTTFKITPPVPDVGQTVDNIWIRIGLERNGPVRISNIELVAT